MQLESSLVGIVVLEVKPQLERLLNLSPDRSAPCHTPCHPGRGRLALCRTRLTRCVWAPDSLAKEIRLTEDLLELFVSHQLPSDLLSFRGAEGADSATRLAAVRAHMAAIHEMLEAARHRHSTCLLPIPGRACGTRQLNFSMRGSKEPRIGHRAAH